MCTEDSAGIRDGKNSNDRRPLSTLHRQAHRIHSVLERVHRLRQHMLVPAEFMSRQIARATRAPTAADEGIAASESEDRGWRINIYRGWFTASESGGVCLIKSACARCVIPNDSTIYFAGPRDCSHPTQSTNDQSCLASALFSSQAIMASKNLSLSLSLCAPRQTVPVPAARTG